MITLIKILMEANKETVTIKTVTMICSVVVFTVGMLIGFNKIVDGSVEKGVANAIEKIHLKQTIIDQRQDNFMEGINNETKYNTREIEKIKEFVYIDRSK